MHKITKVLRESNIIDSIFSIESDAFGGYYKLKIRARLINGWNLQIWEHVTPQFRRYAYHISKGTDLIIRWDNAPHHSGIKTFPYHKHVKEDVLESHEVIVEDILKELERMIKLQG